MLYSPYYAKNYAGIIDTSLSSKGLTTHVSKDTCKVMNFEALKNPFKQLNMH